jgi:hypothetical protein
MDLPGTLIEIREPVRRNFRFQIHVFDHLAAEKGQASGLFFPGINGLPDS